MEFEEQKIKTRPIFSKFKSRKDSLAELTTKLNNYRVDNQDDIRCAFLQDEKSSSFSKLCVCELKTISEKKSLQNLIMISRFEEKS